MFSDHIKFLYYLWVMSSYVYSISLILLSATYNFPFSLFIFLHIYNYSFQSLKFYSFFEGKSAVVYSLIFNNLLKSLQKVSSNIIKHSYFILDYILNIISTIFAWFCCSFLLFLYSGCLLLHVSIIYTLELRIRGIFWALHLKCFTAEGIWVCFMHNYSL